MSLKVSRYDTILNYEYDHFDEKEAKVVLRESQNPNEFIEIQYILPVDNSFNGKTFDIFYLAKSYLRESDIFQVFDKKESKRIGWCIPITALASKDHDFINNEHFLRYAYIALKEVFRNFPNDVFTNLIDVSHSDSISISDIFHESTALLIISRENLSESCILDLPKALPSLFRFGYVKLSMANPDFLTLNRESPVDKKLWIDFMSDQVDNSELIPPLLENVAFCSEASAVLKFFYLYQIIELLLECIFKNEQKVVVRELLSCEDDCSKIKEVLEKVQATNSEKRRISLLMSRYSSLATSDLDLLKSSCNQLLAEIDRKEGVEFCSYFYPVRNFIFHQFWNFPPQKVFLLEIVIDNLLDVLPIVLSSFRLPPISDNP